MKYRKKPVVIEATRWFKNGDHPRDYEPIEIENPSDFDRSQYDLYRQSEGNVVRYYRRPTLDGDDPCIHCGLLMLRHGWIDTLEGGHIVCPGDWIITGVANERYPCKPDIFEKSYELAEE